MVSAGGSKLLDVTGEWTGVSSVGGSKLLDRTGVKSTEDSNLYYRTGAGTVDSGAGNMTDNLKSKCTGTQDTIMCPVTIDLCAYR